MIRTFRGAAPKIDRKAWVHDSAEVIGRVRLGREASVWPQVVLRGDVDRIEVGEGTNIQDRSVLHTRRGQPAIVGRRVTIGHGALVHGTRIADDCLIGMGAVVMEARIGRGSIVGVGAVVTAGTVIPPRSLVLGCPAKVVRRISPREVRANAAMARKYIRLAEETRRTSRVVFEA